MKQMIDAKSRVEQEISKFAMQKINEFEKQNQATVSEVRINITHIYNELSGKSISSICETELDIKI